jgi:hypothetical protein
VMNSRRRMRSRDRSTNERKLHCRLEQYPSHQKNGRECETVSELEVVARSR